MEFYPDVLQLENRSWFNFYSGFPSSLKLVNH